MSKIIIADSETTGVGKEDQIIEFSYVELLPLPEFKKDELGYFPKSFYNERFRPSVPIHPRAKEVHGITFRDLLKCRPAEELDFPKDVKYLIGHNISFDHRMLGKPEVNLICTMNLCKKMVKLLDLDFPNAKLEGLLSVLAPEKVFEERQHSAIGDVKKNIIVLKALLERLPNISSWDELYSLQQSLKKGK